MEEVYFESYDPPEFEKLKSRLLAGEARAVEQEIFAKKAAEAGAIYQKLIQEVTNSIEGRTLAKKLIQQNRYHILRMTRVTVTIQDGQRIRIPSFYALRTGKKKGPRKTGPNGRGIHVLLSYWGYINKYSPNHVEQVARCGVGSASYDLAEAELQAQGMSISSKTVDHIVQEIGERAQHIRSSIMITAGETLAGKRVLISLDGGRIRSREWKTGRPKKEQKQVGFTTPWREPKLLVIAEIDEHGKKKNGAKPLYEATMGGPDDLYQLLSGLCRELKLEEAEEIACIGDGSDWIWNIFSRLIEEQDIQKKTTRIADYYHAVEHLTEISELQTGKSEKERKQWARQLSLLLREGKFDLVKQLVRGESERQKIPEMIKQFGYFEKRRQWMRYDEYEKKKLPIGSGIVESAIKRVINQRVKAPGSFWKLENVERMLQLRCALMAGRWQVLITNLFAATRLAYSYADM